MKPSICCITAVCLMGSASVHAQSAVFSAMERATRPPLLLGPTVRNMPDAKVSKAAGKAGQWKATLPKTKTPLPVVDDKHVL